MKPKKKIMAPIAILIIVGLIIAGILQWRNGSSSDEIHISGNIELTEVRIGFKMAGRLTDLAVDEGDPVAKGAIVARLDRDQLERQHDSAVAVLSAAEAGLVQLYTAIAYQSEMVESQVEQRQAELNSAQANLDKLLAGSRTQEIEQAKAAVEEAQAQLTQAQRDWERSQTLYKNQNISAAQLDQAHTQYKASFASHRRLKAQKAMVIEGPRQEDIAAARAQVTRAQAGLRSAQAGGLELTRRQQEVDVRRADIDRAGAQVALVEAQLEDTIAVTPIDGVVLVKAAQIGEILAPGTTVLTIGDLARPWLRGYIAEQDLGRVQLGQKVRVTTDSFPGKIYAGRIAFIASEAEFTPKQIQTREERVKLVYRIKIEIDNPAQELKLNMPADAIVEVQGS